MESNLPSRLEVTSKKRANKSCQFTSQPFKLKESSS